MGKWIICAGSGGGVSERVKVQGVFYDDVTTLRATHACENSLRAQLADCRPPGGAQGTWTGKTVPD